MAALKKVLIIVLGLYVSVLAMGFLLPKTSTISRSIIVDAPPALLFELVSNHQDFRRWSPWSKKDPNMEVNYSGPTKGIGAKSSWSSQHPEVGTGEAVYTEYEPYSMARMALSFEQGGGDAIFTLTELEEGQTQVEWAFETQNGNVFARYISYFFLDGMLGGDFESGLVDLKTLAESVPAIKTKEVTYSHEGVELTGFLAQPFAALDAPVVFVVHEWWGHNANVRKRAVMLAELGYNAFAIDMYGDGKLASHPADAKQFMMSILQNTEVMTGRFEAAMAYIATQNTLSDSPMAAIGYCFGGAVALNMARQGKDLRGVVSFHGGLGALLPVNQGDKPVPSLVLNGAEDPFVTAEHIEQFKQEMDSAQAPYTFINYPDAKHSFTVAGVDEYGEKFDMPLAYNKEADHASWQAMQGFLADIFKN